MADGPRDWNPPGYWDGQPTAGAGPARAARPVTRGRATSPHVMALLAILLGLGGALFPLEAASSSGSVHGFAWSTFGVSAVFFAYRAGKARYPGGRSSPILAFIGGLLGVAGVVLSLWSVLAFYNPTAVPPLPHLGASTAAAAPALPIAPPTAATLSATTTALSLAPEIGRIVPALPGADLTTPATQLHANLVNVALMLGSAAAFSPTGGPVPAELTVQPDGLVATTDATFSVLPAYMRMSYAPSADLTSFVLTITDIQSGMSVQFNSVTRQLAND
jgi:hypothetical protein